MNAASDRQRFARSLEIMHEYQWMLLRHLYLATRNRFGADGVAALERGLREFGSYRGRAIADSPAAVAHGRNALSLIQNWDLPDFVLAAERGPVQIEIGESSANVVLERVPGSDYFTAKGGRRALELYWSNVLPGLAAGYEEGSAFTTTPVDAAPWALTWTAAGEREPTERRPHRLEDVLADGAGYLRLARRTTGMTAALQMCVGRELLDEFDASGEEALREACFDYGAERGLELRERHLAAGIPLNLESMVGKLAEERDPLGAIFVVRGASYVSPGLQKFDCTYCPLAEVWAERGSDGLALGYIFDMELHRGLVETYYPGAIVRWDLLKTRGDSICRFRFSIPELMTQADRDAIAS
jgi:hypothetical protein